ncbi:MAG: PAS domain S-box protein [Betaproteobacteria bacterium]|nr:PAS domain S-box protein [Betaproteobacteria bacterium]
MKRYFEKELTLRIGDKRWFAVSNAFVDSPDGAPRVLSIFRDITERRQLALALADKERHFTALIATTPVGVFETDRDGLCVFVNRRWSELTGLSLEDALGDSWTNALHAEDRERVHAEWMASTAESRPFTLEYRFQRPDGGVSWVLGQSCSLNSETGELIGHLGTITDITGRKQAEAARASLESQLRESQKMQAIGTLAGGIAHDFNNILATILGNVELAREDVSTNPLALQSLDEIHKASARARDLVQQILSFGRRQPTERKRILLCPVIQESVRLLRATLPARIGLEAHCEPDEPAVLADATQIQQILINMVTNAMQAMRTESGHIRILLDSLLPDVAWIEAHHALRAFHAKHPGRIVRLTVRDDGPGMDATTLARIFEPFFTTKPVDEGTGLGLSVVHGIVQTHDGAIEVDSQLGNGSTFTIYLPAADAESIPPLPARNPANNVAAAEAGGGQHILYLDDDESLVFLVTRLLERRGFRVSGYTDQREALAALRADPSVFDLVVTDYNMPGMSGLDVARAVRTICADLPVAIASGFIDETLQTQAESAGVRELIFKANAVEDLCDAFARLAQSVLAREDLPE